MPDLQPDQQQERAEYEREERRVRSILDRLARLQDGSLCFGRKSVEYPVSPWEWKIAVEWMLARIGTVGVVVLQERLCRQKSFAAISIALGIARNDSELMFQVSMIFFVEEMDKLNRNGIPDDYAEQLAA